MWYFKYSILEIKRTPVYCPALWILFKEQNSNTIVAGGIADYDRETNELILEWLQVFLIIEGKVMGS